MCIYTMFIHLICLVSNLEGSDNGDPLALSRPLCGKLKAGTGRGRGVSGRERIRDYLLTLAEIHGLVTVFVSSHGVCTHGPYREFCYDCNTLFFHPNMASAH